MIHPHTELKFISNEVGFGVVATQFIPKGTITWVMDKLDREFSQIDFEKMDPIYQDILETYTFRNNKGNFVLCWDNGKFINHSFNANCLTTAYDFEISIRDIHAGEQLTDDYGYLNISKPFRGVNEGTKRKVVYPDDLLKYYNVWDKKISRVFSRINKLNQPLREVLKEETWEKINYIIDGKSNIDSILTNYFHKELMNGVR